MSYESPAVERTGGSRPGRLVFAFLGGAAAWFLQHALGYALVEINCHSSRLAFTILGLDASAFLMIVVTILTLAVAAAAAVVALRTQPVPMLRESGGEAGAPEWRSRSRFMAQVGFFLNLLFIVAILVTGASLLFLRPC